MKLIKRYLNIRIRDFYSNFIATNILNNNNKYNFVITIVA